MQSLRIRRFLVLGPVLLACAPASGLCAQISSKHAVSPAGFAHISGNRNNTIPFYGMSATYQQIHDAVDMQATTGSPTLLMTGMAFRPAGTFAITAHRWDVQLTLGHTSVSAATASATFASNFTTTPTTVLPYTTVNGPAGNGQGSAKPNDVLYVFPFNTPFTYIAPLGNLCWEWRHRNNAMNASSSPMDATAANFVGAVTVGANFGQGCTAAAQANPATCNHSITGGNINLALANGRANSAALLWLGFQSAQFSIPGWCAPIYLNPLTSVMGTTDAAGSWASGSGPAAPLNVAPYVEVYTQYAFIDGSLPAGVGLSDRGVLCAPAHGGQYVSRMYSLSRTSNGSENATSGSVGTNYGLVTHFAIL